MEHDNTEDLIKEIIGNREITPSDNARARLIDALNSKRKEKKVIWLRYAVAATIVFTLCYVGAKMMLGDVNKSDPIPKMVNEDKPSTIEQEPSVIEKELEAVRQDHLNKTVNIETPKKLPKTTAKTEIPETKGQLKERNEQSEKLLVNLEPKEEALIKIDTTKPVVPKQFIYVTAEDLLAATTSDSTLKLNENLKKPQDTYVESDALLLEMERELFDEKNKGIFNKARRELKKVGEALANRNYKNHKNNN